MARVFGKDDLKEAGPIMQLLEIVNRVIAYRTARAPAAHARDAAHTSPVSDVLMSVLTSTRSSCSHSSACVLLAGHLNIVGLTGREGLTTLELDSSVVGYKRHGASIAV
jgi:hypothetical protein